MANKIVKIDGRKYSLLSEGVNGQVVMLSESECAKVFELGSASAEVTLMQKANGINNLVCRYLRTDITSNYSKELMVMERLFPLQYRAIDVPQREVFFDSFLVQLKQLHSNGFSHWDVKRPVHVASGERLWDNIMLTLQGLRLIDTGNSVTEQDPDFEEACCEDIDNAMEFRTVFLIP